MGTSYDSSRSRCGAAPGYRSAPQSATSSAASGSKQAFSIATLTAASVCFFSKSAIFAAITSGDAKANAFFNRSSVVWTLPSASVAVTWSPFAETCVDSTDSHPFVRLTGTGAGPPASLNTRALHIPMLWRCDAMPRESGGCLLENSFKTRH